MCNHIHSKQSSAESLRSFPSTPFSTQWKPISKPLWRCEWELKFSKHLLLLLQWHTLCLLQYITTLTSASNTSPFLLSICDCQKSLRQFSSLSCDCLASSALALLVYWERWKPLKQRDKKDGGAKGLYRKSIMLFNFADIWPYKTDPGFLFTENNADLLQHYR